MSQPAAPAKKGLSGRAIGGIVIAAVVLIFIFTNWQSVEVKFLFLARPCRSPLHWPSRRRAASSPDS